MEQEIKSGKLKSILPAILAVVLISIAGGVFYFNSRKETAGKIESLQKQISLLEEKIARESEKWQASLVVSPTPSLTPEIRQTPIPSREDILTGAVAELIPSVVSVVISKDVPHLEVVYENPFGSNPFFRDFNIRVPVYRQKGTVRQKIGGGTGFIIRQDGYVLTNRHVAADSEALYTVLLSDGRQKPAQVVYKDAVHDVALLKIEGAGYRAAILGNSGQLKLGQTVIAIGNALAEYNNSVSVGIVSGLNRTIEAANSNGQIERLTGIIQTDAAINPGNSGGPLVDLNGEVVGVNVATVVGSNSISFSIPINSVKNIISSVLK